MADNTPTYAVDYLEKSGAALHEAEQFIQRTVQSREKAASFITPLANQLQIQGLISEAEKPAAEAKLASHEGALEIVGNLLKFREETQKQAAQAQSAGGPGTVIPRTDLVPSRPATNGAPGRAPTRGDGHAKQGEVFESDMAFARSLGVTY